MVDLVGPAMKTFVKHLRNTFDELLDGHSLIIQAAYMSVAVVLLIFAFMKICDFKFKISSLIFSFEFGPDKNTSVTTQVIKLILLLRIFTRPFLGNKRDGNADGKYSRN